MESTLISNFHVEEGSKFIIEINSNIEQFHEFTTIVAFSKLNFMSKFSIITHETLNSGRFLFGTWEKNVENNKIVITFDSEQSSSTQNWVGIYNMFMNLHATNQFLLIL